MKTSVVFFVAAFAAVPCLAQDPYTVAPQAYTKQLENEFVQVTRVHYAPHEQLTEHAHPARPTIYVYLKDGGPVLFKHEHGDSGEKAAIRPATRAGSYRMAPGRNETHIVDNQADVPSDFLQVELKTDIDLTTFTGRRNRDPANEGRDSSKVEFDTPQLRIVRVTCKEAPACTAAASALTSAALQISTATGETGWLTPGGGVARAAGEYLFVEFKHRRP